MSDSDKQTPRKRSVSTAARSILRRKDLSEANNESESDDARGPFSIMSRTPPLAHAQSVRGHTSRLSVAGSHVGSHAGTSVSASASASQQQQQHQNQNQSQHHHHQHSYSYSTSAPPSHSYAAAAALFPASGPAAATASSRLSIGGGTASIESSIRKFRVVEALRSGDTKAIAKAIRQTADPAASSGRLSMSTTMSAAPMTGPLDDTTVLHLAIQCAELPVVEFVLSHSHTGIGINARDRDGNTPLHVAASNGRTPVVKQLLDRNDVNDAIPNNQGKLPIDVTRNADIFQMLQLSRSLFTDAKVKQVQDLVARADYDALTQVLEEPRLKTLLDVNSPEFASDPATVETGGSLLHEAARKKNAPLIQVLLLHGADPFRRDRKGKLPQDVTKDDITRAMLKKSPAAVAAQRGIQEKAVLGVAVSQGASAASPADPLAGKESREMKGYLKKWTNYRKGYQLRWFVLENGVLSYYKHQDDAESVCRGVINMRIARLHMSPDEKTKFEITGKSSVKYTLKANHEVEAKKWFWALNNSIQWTKDQAREEERQRAKSAELLRQAKAEHMSRSTEALGADAATSDVGSVSENRSSLQLHRGPSNATASRLALKHEAAAAGGWTSSGSFDDDFVDATTDGGASRLGGNVAVIPADVDDGDDEDDEDDGDADGDDEDGWNDGIAPSRAVATKDALNITAQSAKLQLEFIAQVNAALSAEVARNPSLTISDSKVTQALSTYDAATRTLKTLIGDLLKISRDRDNYWQYRLNQESQMRRMWEESMAKVAHEQEELQARMGETEKKRKATKRALREVIETSGQQATAEAAAAGEGSEQQPEGGETRGVSAPSAPGSPRILSKRPTQMAGLSDPGTESEDEEFFDAVDAGEVEVSEMPPLEETDSKTRIEVTGMDISSSFKGYENGVRTRLAMDADNRPKVSLWGILKSMIGKDMTKMTLPVTFNEPTSLLYRCGEDMEYVDLLDLAVERQDPIERLMYVAAFAASEYASTIGRVAKPFNPLLGETFEYVRPDRNYRFFIEQVSHHPPVGAAWAESPHWTYYGESHVKSKFYGKSFDINPLGTWFLRLRPKDGSPEELYTWKKVTSTVIGIITGSPTIDNYGPMEIKNWTTGEMCSLDFKPRGWKASSAYQITGKVLDAQAKVRFSMGGRWNSRIYARRTPGFEATIDDDADTQKTGARNIDDEAGSADKAFLLWQANPRPTGIPFNLTPFVLTFNHIDDKLRKYIAPTDSRLRPDQRAMEEGQYDFAADEKNRLEQAQRARRRRREERGEEFAPAWFSKAVCETTGEEYWKFNGKYWDVRERVDAEGTAAWAACGLEAVYEDVVEEVKSELS